MRPVQSALRLRPFRASLRTNELVAMKNPIAAPVRSHPMPSSVIRRFTYDPVSRDLVVEFVTGRVYLYSDVPQDEADAFRAAFSKGRYFNARIRDRYSAREL